MAIWNSFVNIKLGIPTKGFIYSGLNYNNLGFLKPIKCSADFTFKSKRNERDKTWQLFLDFPQNLFQHKEFATNKVKKVYSLIYAQYDA
jgi:hypothetical protein